MLEGLEDLRFWGYYHEYLRFWWKDSGCAFKGALEGVVGGSTRDLGFRVWGLRSWCLNS